MRMLPKKKTHANGRLTFTGSGSKSFPCPECGKGFSRLSNMTRHVQDVHESRKDHRCEICGMAFSEAGNLMQRYLTYTGEKFFRCPVCRKRFSQNGNMKQHVASVHEGLQPHDCRECDKTFGTGGDLKKHLLTHSGEKKHHCPVYNKAFTLSSNIKAHIQRHHTHEKGFPCLKCDKKFVTSIELKRHTRIHK